MQRIHLQRVTCPRLARPSTSLLFLSPKFPHLINQFETQSVAVLGNQRCCCKYDIIALSILKEMMMSIVLLILQLRCICATPLSVGRHEGAIARVNLRSSDSPAFLGSCWGSVASTLACQSDTTGCMNCLRSVKNDLGLSHILKSHWLIQFYGRL